MNDCMDLDTITQKTRPEGKLVSGVQHMIPFQFSFDPNF
jgi:hypothetical protein